MTFARSNCVLSKALHRKVKENERLHRFLVPKDFLLSASRFRFEVHLFTTTEGNRFVKRNDTAIFDVNDQYTWHAILTRTDHEINPRENKEVCPHLVPRMYVSLSADGQRVPFYESGEEFLFHLPPTPPRLSESEKEKVELEFLPLKDQKKQRECVWELQPLSDANEPLPGGVTLSNRTQSSSNSNSSSPASSRSLSSSLYNDDTSLSSSSRAAASSSSLLDTPLYGVSEGVLFSRLREDWGAGAPHSALTPLLRFRKNEAVDLPRIIRPAAHALRLTASALPPPPCLSGSGPSSSVSSPSSLSRRSNSPSVSMDDGDISPWGSPGKRARGLSHESPTAALPLPPALSIALPAAPTDGVELVYQWNDPQMPPQIRLERQLAYVAFDVVQQGRVRSVYHPWHSDLFLMSRDAVGCFLYFNPRQRHVFENVATHLDNNELLVQGRFLWEASDIRESRFEIQLAPALSMTISQPNLAVLNLDEFLPDPALSFSAPSHLMDTAPSLSLHGHGGLSFPSFPPSSSSSAPGTSASMASSFFPNSIDALLGRHLNSDGFLGMGMGMGMGSVGEGSDCFSMPADTVPINFSTPDKEPTPLCGEADHGDAIPSSAETCHKNTSPTPACCDKVDYATTPDEGGDKLDTWTGATSGSTSDETIDDDDDEDILREFVKISMEDVPSPAALSASPSGCSSAIPRKKKQAPRMCVKTEAGCVLM